jgi:hypothetical protein
MRLALSVFSSLLVVAQLASAGLVIVQEADHLGPDAGRTRMTLNISGERARIDVGDQLSSIVDLKSGNVTSLMHPQKIAMQLPKEALAAIREKAAEKTEKPDLEPTGKKETINGYACTEYAGTLQGLAVTYWVTNDVPDQKAILDQMAKLAGSSDIFKGALASGADFPGFPIRTTVTSPQLGTSTMTVISIRKADLPDSEFEIPAGYQTLKSPLPGAGGN